PGFLRHGVTLGRTRLGDLIRRRLVSQPRADGAAEGVRPEPDLSDLPVLHSPAVRDGELVGAPPRRPRSNHPERAGPARPLLIPVRTLRPLSQVSGRSPKA